ncbi:RxLR effector protein [Phytophthora megakarya]|uniref:RxLR effector protein n=1 Tax=Phytophthora megakarya TaxID=4795 RepID=A0A225URN2_9STRA|nr:RxLR effector protein [Phytophthora megakarya]
MGFYQVVLLIGVLLLGSSDWIQASTNSRLGASGTTTRSLERDDSVTRFLRAYPADEGVDDERGISAYLPGVEKLSNIFKSSRTKELERKIKADDSIDDSFTKLIRNTLPMKNGQIDADKVHLLFLSRKFKVWTKHAAKMNKFSHVKPETAMLTTLMKTFSERDIARMIYVSKDASWTAPNKVIKKLEKTQFNKWFREGLDPTQVVEKVLKVEMRYIERSPTEEKIWEAYSKWYTLKKLHH